MSFVKEIGEEGRGGEVWVSGVGGGAGGEYPPGSGTETVQGNSSSSLPPPPGCFKVVGRVGSVFSVFKYKTLTFGDCCLGII